MSERRAVSRTFLKKISLAGSLLVIILSGVDGHAKPNRKAKTVGDILKRIETQTSKVNLKKSSDKLPQFQKFENPRTQVNLQQVKPPSTSQLYYEEGTKDASLEKVTDQGIAQLYKLSKQFKNSPRRGEIWLRLAELYVEKARLIEYKLSQDFEKASVEFQEKKRKTKPKLDLKPAQAYNKKAIQLYSWFIRDYPKDEKVDQALFFLGYNHFELGDEETGKQYYDRLTKEFPKSSFNEEASFALGEYHFERNEFEKAMPFYARVAKVKRSRLYSFSKYKMAWTQYKMGQMKNALNSLEDVIRAGRSTGKTDDGGLSRIRLASEASKDLVVFYAEVGTPNQARGYFESLVGDEEAKKLVEKLAYFYAGTGNLKGARTLFGQLIAEAPKSEKAFEYQYQIVSLYSSSSTSKEFRGELFDWVTTYGPKSDWQQSNKGNKELISKVNQLMESTLRNHILQLHQTAQNSKAPYSQARAKESYQLYFKTFDTGEKADEMHFFFAELLFDMNDFEPSAFHYNWIVKNTPKSQYAEKSKLNTVLALEKVLPSEGDLKKRLGDSLEPVPLEKNVKNFLLASGQYIEAYPKGDNVPAIRYKSGALYYYHNQFDEALKEFNTIIKEHPKSQYAEYSANLTLDIYNLKKDFVGLEKAGAAILENESLAQGQVGTQVKSVLQQVSFKKAQELETEKKYVESAQAFEQFAISNKGSDLAVTAMFNAAVNYERAGDLSKSASMHGLVLASKASKEFKDKSEKILPSLYERIGDYKKAAKMMEAYANAHPKDPAAINYLYNAAVIQDGVNWFQSATKNYQSYFDKTKNADRFDTLFLLGKIWERQNGITKASEYYERFFKSQTKDKSAVVESAFRTAEIYRKKNKKNERDNWLNRTISSQKSLSTSSEKVGVRFAAEAKFEFVRRNFDELVKIKIPANPAQQKGAIEKKLAALNKLKDELKSVIIYDDGQMVVAALTLLGQAYQHMAASIYGVPTPKGLDDEGLKQYKEGVKQLAQPFEKDAIANYKAAIDRGRALKGYNEWLITAGTELARLEPSETAFKGERFVDNHQWDRFTKRLSDSKFKDLKMAVDASDEQRTIEQASNLLGKDNNNLEALMALASLHYDRKEFGLAEIILSRALTAHPKEAAIFHNLGILSLQRGEGREALASFEQALAMDWSHSLAAQSVGGIYLKYHDFQKAHDTLKQIYTDNKSAIKKGDRILMEIANCYAVASSYVGESEQALTVYNMILSNDPQNVSVLLNKSILLAERIKRKKEAQEVLNKLKFLTDDKIIQKKVADLEAQLSQLKD